MFKWLYLCTPNLTVIFKIYKKKNCVFVSSIYCILQRKTKNTYVEMLQIIMDECAERNLYLDPKHLHHNFESSVIEAAKEVIGVQIDKETASITCVSQHSGKCKNWVCHIVPIRKQCGMIDILVFLHFVKDGMKHLKNNLPENLLDLLN